MKIKNVEKFREALYKAIDDSYILDGHIETPLYTWKNGHDEPELADTYAIYEDGECISLPHPLHVEGSRIWMTIDWDGDASFWLSHKTHFELLFFTPPTYYGTQMAYAIAIADDLRNTMKKYDRDELNIDRIEV